MYPLTIDEILDETNQMDVSIRNRHWLVTEVGLSVCGNCSVAECFPEKYVPSGARTFRLPVHGQLSFITPDHHNDSLMVSRNTAISL